MNLYKTLYNNYLDFYPTSKMTLKEKILSLIRFFIYLSIIGIIFFRSLIIVSIIGIIILYLVYNNITEPEEVCYHPSRDNPAMNITYYEQLMKDKPKACDIDNETIRKEYIDSISYNMYENENDIFFSKNQERIFYGQPVKEIINDQDKYLGKMYNIYKTCKQDRFNCLPQEFDLNLRDIRN
jgi:hypothetical protein